MNMRDLPIGVFDSGLGGLSVLRELIQIMPDEDFIYFGDSKNAPYGTKSHEEILHLSVKGAQELIDHGIKSLVIACNTATSLAVNTLRETYKALPIIGLEPALKPAVENSKGGKIIVMATPATLAEEKFAALLKKHKEGCDISLLPAPGLVETVEKGAFDSPELYSLLEELFAPFDLEKVESVVLGCTHYPFVKKEIIKTVGSHVTLYDGGRGAAAETKRRLSENDLLSFGQKGTITITNSLDNEAILKRSYELLESPIYV